MEGNSYSWEYIDTKHPVLGVNAIAIDPKNSDVIYIGTGEVYGYQKSFGGFHNRTTRGSYGIGLLKSTDRGKTWGKSIDWSYNQERGVLCIKIHPQDNKIVFAGTSEGTYKTTDAGKTWERVDSTLMAVDLVINPKNPNFVFVACGNLNSPGSGLYRSKNGGQAGSFKKLTNGIPTKWGGKTLLAIYQANPDIVFADVAEGFRTKGLYKSTNGGDSWSLINSTDYASYQGWFAHYVRVNPQDDSKVMCAGVGFYVSTDGGKTIKKKSGMHVDHHCYADHPTNPNIVYFGNDGGVYRTTDGGNSYKALNNGYITSQFYNGYSISAKNGKRSLGGLQDNSSVMYEGKKNWRRGLIGGDGAFTAINTENDDIMYGSSQNLNVKKSTDGGRRWTSISSQLTGKDVCFIAPFVLVPSKPSIMYAGKDIIHRSDNGGDNWKKLNNGKPLNGKAIVSIAVSPNNPDRVYAATVPTSSKRAEVFASSNGGNTWENITGNLPNRFYLDMQVSPHDDKVLYVALLGFGSSHLYRTEDGTSNWVDIGKGLPDIPTSAVVIDPDNYKHIYVGNDIGVYVSTDYGEKWRSFTEGLPSAILSMDLTISPSNKMIHVATHGNGVYERKLISANTPITNNGLITSKDYKLLQNYPNPIFTHTMIEFSLPQASFVLLRIFTLKGQEIRTLAATSFPQGKHQIRWDARDHASHPVANGTYLCRLQVAQQTKTTTMRVSR